MKYFFRLLALSTFFGCKSHGQAPLSNQGQLTIASYYYSRESGQLLDSIVYKIWWRGEKSIQQVPLLKLHQDALGKDTNWVEITHYSFLDSKKNICVNFRGFTDTSKILKLYSDIDSVRVGGGWNFLSNTRLEFDTAMRLSDTLIGSETFARVMAMQTKKKWKIDFMLYLKCDDEDRIIRLHRPQSDSLGCDIIRNDTFIDGKLFSSLQIKLVADTLTEQEIRLFDAWNIKGEAFILRKKPDRRKN